ncbi:MAG TPA: efflux RND transporter periplasmic adaptor subunit [Pseudomonadales bacterium]|nr:efflux RND transporter periplasmic adaptor subunit [Pseudomonadales bacterium]
MRLFCVALALSLALSGCGKKPVTEAAAVIDVTALKIVPHDTPVSFEYVAQTQSASQVQIVARVDGFLDKRVYTEGSMVKGNEVMFQQDPKPFQATLSAAKAALAEQQARLQVATDNFNRVQPLVALNALSQKDLDDATGQKQAAAAAVDMAKANVEQAELNLGYTTIRSPVDGLSSYSRVNVGSYIDAKNSLLTYVSPLDPMYVNFSVSENDMLKLRSDAASGRVKLPERDRYTVEVILADGSTFDQKGLITFTDADFNQETGTFLIRATLPNPKSVLRPGQFVRARVLGAIRPNAILVPQASVLQGAQGHFVVVVDKDNKAQIRPVQVGPWYGNDWFIDSGLEAGDTVVVDGVARLAPGTAVKITGEPKPSSAPAAAAS